jgi:hypothetical protein
MDFKHYKIYLKKNEAALDKLDDILLTFKKQNWELLEMHVYPNVISVWYTERRPNGLRDSS